jgi:RimJ/RimL family protein N-acetyltransferase
MFIRSERLFLRPGWPEDWREVLTRITDEDVVRNLASVPWPYTAEDAMAFVGREQERMLPHFLITLPGSDGAQLIGCIGLSRFGEDIELGYWIAREHWGQGYATEAARAVLRLAAALGHRHLTASHFADNPASGAVLRKLGFTPAGSATRFSAGRGEASESLIFALAVGECCGGGDDDAESNAKAA